MTRHCLCAPTGNARSHNSIFLNAFEAQNLFQNDLETMVGLGLGLDVGWIFKRRSSRSPCGRCSGPRRRRWPGSTWDKEPIVEENNQWVNLLNLLLKQLSGIPLLDTVVRGTRQSGDEGDILMFLILLSHHLPRWKNCRCKCSRPRPRRTWPPSERESNSWFHPNGNTVEIACLAPHIERDLFDLIDKGWDESIHLHSLPREHLRNLRSKQIFSTRKGVGKKKSDLEGKRAMSARRIVNDY